MVLRASPTITRASWSVGIPVERAIGAVMGARRRCRRPPAGMLWGSIQGVDWTLSLLLLKALTVAVLGGLDSIPGVLSPASCSASCESVAPAYLDPLLGGGTRDVVASVLILSRHGPALRPVRPRRHREDVMLYRQAGIRHTNYRADRALFPLPFDR